MAVQGHTIDSLTSARQKLQGLLQDSDFEHLRDLKSPVRKPSSDWTGSGDHMESKTLDAVELAAKTVCIH